MTTHMTEEQFAAAVAGERDAALGEHLRECGTCHDELAEFERATEAMRQAIRANAPQEEGFWARQRAEIHSRIESPERIQPRPLAWAGAMAAMVLAALLMSQTAPRELPQSAQMDPDERLLLDIAASTQRQVPRALAPAGLLAQEMRRALESQQAE